MSGTPNKRVHEEIGGHSSLSRYPHPPDDSNSKLPNPSTPNDYHTSFDMGQDPRMPKVPRTEPDTRRPPLLPTSMSRRLDSQTDHAEPDTRRPPLLPTSSSGRLTSALNDRHYWDHAVEERDSKIRDTKVEARDVNPESKDLYQGDVRFTRVDDHKETKYDRSVYSGYGNEAKTDNVVKESKEHHRAWKSPDTSGGNMDSWHGSRSNVHEGLNSNSEVKDYSTEVHETVSENKVDLKGEDFVRKRKEVKHREWGDNSNNNNNNNNKDRIEGVKDPTKEERNVNDVQVKDKDKVKDHVKRDSWAVNEKEGPGPQHEKDDADVSSSRGVDLGKQKSVDNWKDSDKESKERVVEKDADVEGGADVEAGADVDGSADREREGFSYGVQQRKRMLRPRGSPQVANRDPRFRSRPQDNDGSTGKSEVSTIIYRVGECVQELLNLWNEYKSSDKTSETSKSYPTLEIRIPAEHVTATNRQVKGGQLWGTDVYTHDSDLVAVLMHTGYCRPTASPPPPAIQELRATVRVLPPQDCYVSTLRNNVRSRAWGAAIDDGCSFRVERCHIVKKAGGTIDLEPCLTHTSTVEPTLAPVVVERTMTTRAAASNALRQQRFVREVTLQYNLCNEPWIKYSISAIADKGLKKPLFTSARLKKGEVLYLESPSQRFELCFNGEKMVKAGNEMDTNGVDSDSTTTNINNNNINNNNINNGNHNNNNMMDVFRWSLCKKPLPQTVMRSIGIPLPPEHLKVLEENLDWEDIQWSQTGVWISGKEYPLSRVHFLSPV